MTLALPSANMRNYLEQACRTYEENLNGSPAEKYLLKRGITKEVQTYFRLGFVHEENLSPGHERYVGRLAIPYVTPSGIVQIRFRAVPEDGIPGNPEDSPKYLSESGAPKTFFNPRALGVISDVLAVCEGEIDTMSCVVAGIQAIGIPGDKGWIPVFARALKYRNIVILADNDDKGTGREHGETVQRDVRGSKLILMPSGYDVNKFLVDFGPEALRKKVGIKDDSQS